MAVKTKPIKTDLFKFVTLRSPQLINEQKKDIGFIFHKGNISKESKFIEGISLENDLVKAREAVITKARAFLPLEKLIEVKEINKEMYQFSSWLMHNRNVILTSESIEKTALVLKPTLTIVQENLLWDNLYYQVITRKSSYVRQACIQMLIAHNYLLKKDKYDAKKAENTEEEYLVRLANAKVVINKSFTKEEQTFSKSNVVNKRASKKLKKDIKKYYYRKNIENYKSVLSEISDLEFNYTKAYNKAFKLANKAHKTEVESLIKIAEDKIKPLQAEENLMAKNEKRNAIIIPLEVNLPKFKFTFENHFSDTYKNKLSTATKNILLSHNITEDVTLEETKQNLKNRIDYYKNKLASFVITKKKHVFVNGAKVPRKEEVLKPHCYTLSIIKSATNPLGDTANGGIGNSDLSDAGIGTITDLFIEDNASFDTDYSNTGIFPKMQRQRINKLIYRINLGSPNATVASQTHTLQVSNPNINNYEITETVVELVSLDNGILTINMFPSSNLLFIRESTLQLTGEFVLSDGSKLSYTTAISLQTKTAQGCAKNTSGGVGNENPEVQLYGIGKIGVADFRKVEQTVCCYVAGEVSHIENVMAKEFKKRETRSLLSSETTTETTTETEVENLTDTTTTERNEMQTEVSKVLNEDNAQNYGGSSEVQGGKEPKYSVSGHADFANSSSSSLSNTQAQIYAQEITERTLERVISKTSKKQTSRILKEFEEVNQHGFDNRKGNQHVSGVYRWIDIIYKNQLVNYGKRLMYEFMVPEPAQFFREAIEIKGGNSPEIMAVDEPIHPSKIEEGINDATELTKNNYLQLASAYGVEVKPIPKKNISISKGFSFHNDSEGSMADSKEASLVIPKNYKAIRYQVDGGASNQNGSGSNTISIADILIRNSNTDNVYARSGSLDNIVDNITIAVAIDRYYTFSIGVVIMCERTQEAIEKWQNETYTTILDGYYKQVEKYNNYLIVNGITGDNEKVKFSNSFNRILEKREIKRICINMLVKSYNNPFDQENYELKQGDLYKTVKQDANFENHAAHVKFFEQAFEWDIMAYKFYDYFWANQEKWITLFQESSNADPIFQAFLQSGMARTIVPVRPGFEDAVLYYIETGDIWNGGDLVIDQENDLYISIADEMQSTEGAVEKEWETRVPTALTMIQKDTVGLQETGLPCCNDGGLKPIEMPIQATKVLIGGEQPIDVVTTP